MLTPFTMIYAHTCDSLCWGLNQVLIWISVFFPLVPHYGNYAKTNESDNTYKVASHRTSGHYFVISNKEVIIMYVETCFYTKMTVNILSLFCYHDGNWLRISCSNFRKCFVLTFKVYKFANTSMYKNKIVAK